MVKIMPLESTSKTFVKAGNRFISDTGSITIHKRKTYTSTKPEQYVVYTPPQGGKPEYLSGLYPRPDGTFIAEFKGIYWAVTLTADEVHFHQLPK
jgi:hypothetical protein